MCIVDSGSYGVVFFLMKRRPPRSTQSRSSAASDVYKRQEPKVRKQLEEKYKQEVILKDSPDRAFWKSAISALSLIHISEPTRPY